MTAVNGTTAEADDPWFEGLPDQVPVLQSRGLTDDQVLDVLRHGPNGALFRLLYEHGDTAYKNYPSPEQADVAFVKLLLPYTGAHTEADFEQIDHIFKDSQMRNDQWSFDHVGSGLYYRRVIMLAAVDLAKQWTADPDGAVGDQSSTPEAVFAAATQTVQDFMASAPEVVDALVEDFIVVGGITSLSARVKLGKTELTMHLAGSVARGTPIFGKQVRQAKVLYLTEQAGSVREAIKRVGIRENQDMWITPWHKVHKLTWPEIVAEAVGFCQSHGIKLLVVDTLSRFARIKDENDSAEAMQVMAPLHEAIATANLAILTVRHDRKSGGDLSDSARGSSAYNGEADILIGLRMPDGKRDLEDDDDDEIDRKDRRRVLVATSRYGEPDDLMVKLTTDNEYIVLGQPKRVKVEAERTALLARVPLGRENARKWNDVQVESGLSRRRAKELRNALETEGVVSVDTERPSNAVIVWQQKPAQVSGGGAAGDD